LNEKYLVQTEQTIGGIQVHQTTEFHFETTVPLSSRFANHFVVPFEGSGFDSTSAIALVNPSFQVPADVTVRYRDNSGNLICSELITLTPGQEQTFALFSPPNRDIINGVTVCGTPNYQDLQGKVGVAEFSTPNLELSGFALRFGQLGFVSYPAQSL